MRGHESSDDSGGTDSETDIDTGPPRTVCRQCPGYAPGGAFAAAAATLSSTSDASMTPTVTQTFQCCPTQTHVICQCCIQPMPDRRSGAGQTDTPLQECLLCGRAFCHLYWGCSRSGCRGCLAKFRDMNFAETCLSTIVLTNEYESNVLRGYMQTRNIALYCLL
ncbi:E3 ubiquitin-protein ligase CHFR [Lamellibrachia satsuma]|nr:E3 ubiquitin-protein ligase CHFR [Lamellibrachia satsuma]